MNVGPIGDEIKGPQLPELNLLGLTKREIVYLIALHACILKSSGNFWDRETRDNIVDSAEKIAAVALDTGFIE